MRFHVFHWRFRCLHNCSMDAIIVTPNKTSRIIFSNNNLKIFFFFFFPASDQAAVETSWRLGLHIPAELLLIATQNINQPQCNHFYCAGIIKKEPLLACFQPSVGIIIASDCGPAAGLLRWNRTVLNNKHAGTQCNLWIQSYSFTISWRPAWQ